MEYNEECADNDNFDYDSDSESPKKKKKCRTVNPSQQGTLGTCFGLGSYLEDLNISEVRADVYVTFAMFTAVLAILRLLPKY